MTLSTSKTLPQLEASLPATVPDLLAHELESLEPLLDRFRRVVRFDACIVGIGKRNEYGEVVAVRCLCENIPHEFLDGYAGIAEHDAAAQLFASHATSVLAISSLDDYPFDSTPHGKVGAYLRKQGVAFLLLCGVDSSRGIAWATFYRKEPGCALARARTELSELLTEAFRNSVRGGLGEGFSVEECERASYVIRSGLFEWQEACNLPTDRPPRAERYQMIPLLPREMDVALRRARGHSQKEITGELGFGRSTYNNGSSAMKAIGLTSAKLAERLLGELPPARIDRHKRRGPKLKTTTDSNGEDRAPDE